MSEPLEVQMARLEERLKVIFSSMEKAEHGRKQQYESLEGLRRTLQSIEGRVENVENSLAKASPTLDEFIIIKHKVIGAGMLGKWLLAGGGTILGIVFSMRESILAWLSK